MGRQILARFQRDISEFKKQRFWTIGRAFKQERIKSGERNNIF